MSGSGSSRKAHDLLRSIQGFTEANASSDVENRPIRLGTVDYNYDPADFMGGIYPRIMFDGEKVVSEKRYKTMMGYYPLPGQRVVLLPIGTTYLIVGTVSAAPLDPKVDIYTTVGTDTWEKPQGARIIVVECQGGGGAGGGAAATNTTQASAGAGGCGGAYAKSTLVANAVADSVTITVGALGAGASGTTGGNGTASSFGTTVTADGGLGGGTIPVNTTPRSNNGAPGFAQVPVGDIAVPGQGGGAAFLLGTGVGTAVGYVVTGMGGSSVLGGGGRGLGTNTTTVVSGAVGMGYGAGGGGTGNGVSQSAIAGGDGTQGIVIVTTYF